MLMMSPSKAEQKYDQCWMIYQNIRTEWMSVQGLSWWLQVYHPPNTINLWMYRPSLWHFDTGGKHSEFYCRTPYNNGVYHTSCFYNSSATSLSISNIITLHSAHTGLAWPWLNLIQTTPATSPHRCQEMDVGPSLSLIYISTPVQTPTSKSLM